MDDVKYYKWLHDLTTLGYKKKIAISVSHKTAIDKWYNEKKSPQQTLDLYIEFLANLH